LLQGKVKIMTETDGAASPLSLRLFGSFEVRLDGAPLPRLRSRKGQWLFALLTLRAGRGVERSWLAGMLWPESDLPQALSSLRKSLGDLRQALGPEGRRVHTTSAHCIVLDLTGADADVVAFDAAVRQGNPSSLDQAVALYRGPLLEGWSEEWVFQERQAREQAYLQALETLAEHALEHEGAAAAERYLRLAVAADPLRESAQRALMEALAAGGNYAAATQTYRDLRLLLHRELNAEPCSETQTLYQRLREEARRRAQVPSSMSVSHSAGISAVPLVETGIGRETATFLFTDIEGSTQLGEQQPERMREALGEHDTLLRQVIVAHGGQVFKTVGDAFCAAFVTAPEALQAALRAQQRLWARDWGRLGKLPVRMALHTGTVEPRTGDYYGLPLNRTARLLRAGHGGQILLSQATYELVRDELPEGVALRDLGEHRLKDLQRPEQVYQLLHPELPAGFPPLRSLEVRSRHLPVQLTSFIGREREMNELKRLLATHRLVTLTGTGGCGKTRLAIQVAADLLEEYADGVWVVELEALVEPALVLQEIAQTLGVREEPGRTLLDTLSDRLRSRQMLLVLDNCEHLVTSCAAVADALLRSCPNLQVLATSREILGVKGETLYRVPPLTLPELQRLPPIKQLKEYESVRLFTERALSNQPCFAVTAENASAVAAVCHRLEGIPLAIELAAARIRILSIEQLSARLEDRFRLLTGGSRTALPRQQTLRATMDWSYDLLSEAEQILLRRLSVFAGGFNLEAAEAVCAGALVADDEVMELLGQLVDKSLVIVEVGADELRYRMLETIRQYGQQKLLGTGEAEPIRDRHRNRYLELAERAEPELCGPEQGEWLRRLETDYGNLRTSLEWALESRDVSLALRLAGALSGFWHARGYTVEAREHMAAVLALPDASPRTEARAKVLRLAGALANDQGHYNEARALCQESLTIWRELGNKQGIATVLNQLGEMEWERGNYADARALCEESLALRRELGDPGSIAGCLYYLGTIAYLQGDHQAARSLCEESLKTWHGLGDKRNIARSLNTLGSISSIQGNYQVARGLFQESLTLYRDLGDRRGTSEALSTLGDILHTCGDYSTAHSLLQESLTIKRELGDRLGIGETLGHLGQVALEEGDDATARACHMECLAICRELHDKRGVAWALENQGDVALCQGEIETARALFEESLTMRRELEDKQGIAVSLFNLGRVAQRQDAHRSALSLYRESLVLFQEVGFKRLIGRCLAAVAMVATRQKQFDRGVKLFGAAAALNNALGTPLPKSERIGAEHHLAEANDALNTELFTLAWAAGWMMPFEEAVAYSMEDQAALSSRRADRA
jgi:predicted ATPase/class 3 adenylate cyclase